MNNSQGIINAKLSENTILLKKMREIKKLTRKQVGTLFNISFKTVEKLENGRGQISDEKIMQFARAFGFDLLDLQLMREGRYGERLLKNEVNPWKDPKRRDRRFCQKKISKQCRVLRELRLRHNISQYQASHVCGFNHARIGHIENGRVNLSYERLCHIVKTYGSTMEEFQKLMLQNGPLEHELLDECSKIIHELETSKLRAVHGLLMGFAK